MFKIIWMVQHIHNAMNFMRKEIGCGCELILFQMNGNQLVKRCDYHGSLHRIVSPKGQLINDDVDDEDKEHLYKFVGEQLSIFHRKLWLS